jgi:hypothetical protein
MDDGAGEFLASPEDDVSRGWIDWLGAESIISAIRETAGKPYQELVV